MKTCILSMLAFCASLFLHISCIADTLLIKNGVYLNPESNTMESVSVLVKDNVIVNVGKELDTSINSKIKVLDAKGAMLLPGMIDLHTHSWGNNGLRSNGEYQYIGHRGSANAFLYAGIHGALDLFSDEETILNYRDNHFPTRRDEAYLFAVGPCFTATGGHCSQMGTPTRIIDSPDDVEKHIKELLSRRPNALKIVLHGNEHLPTVDEATLATFLTQAKIADIPSIVHVGSWHEVRTATIHGASAVTHIPWTPMPKDIPALMAEHSTAIIPTVGLLAELYLLQNQSKLPGHAQPLINNLVSSELRAQFPIAQKDSSYQKWLQKHHGTNALGNISDSLQTLYQAGVDILPGSDSGNEAMYQGIGLHRELAHLQSMGIPTGYLIQAVTRKAQHFLGLQWGIVPGNSANFILVNPKVTEDIQYSTDIHHIILNGRLVQREKLLKYANPGWWQYTKLFLGFED